MYTGIGLDLDVCTGLSNSLQVPGSTASMDSSLFPVGAAGMLAVPAPSPSKSSSNRMGAACSAAPACSEVLMPILPFRGQSFCYGCILDTGIELQAVDNSQRAGFIGPLA